MRYSKKVTFAPLVVLVVCGSLVAYIGVGHEKQEPIKPKAGPSSLTSPITTSSNQTFAGIEGMKIAYPSLWSATPGINNSRTKDQLSVVFKAPNTLMKTHSSGDEEVKNGAKITLYKNNFAKTKTLDEYKKSDSFAWKYAENKKDSVVNNVPVVEFDNAYEGKSQHYAVFYKDSREYIMVMDGDVHKKPEYKEVFDNMMKNMEFTKSP